MEMQNEAGLVCGINRNIMECKLAIDDERETYGLVLIET